MKIITFKDNPAVIIPGQSFLISDYTFSYPEPDYRIQLDILNDFGTIRILPASANVGWNVSSFTLDILLTLCLFF